MTLRATRHLRLGAGTLVLTLLAGCAQSPPTQFYTLDPLAPGAPAQATAGPVLRVDHVTVPAVMDRPELVREHGAERLKVDDFNHWGAPLGDLVRAALIEDLTARLAAGRVLPAEAPRLDGAADLVIEIAAVHEQPGSLVMDVDWTLTQHPPASGGPVPNQGQSQAMRTLRHERIEAPLAGPSQQAFADALSRATAILADRIVAGS